MGHCQHMNPLHFFIFFCGLGLCQIHIYLYDPFHEKSIFFFYQIHLIIDMFDRKIDYINIYKTRLNVIIKLVHYVLYIE